MSTLLLRLSGPMQSWGTSSRFRFRETGLEPSKSGVIGLICAALGKPRQEIPDHATTFPTLAELTRLRMGVRVDRPGEVRRDFQTAGGSHRQGESYGVINANGNQLVTVLSDRYYLSDASFLVGLEGDLALLERIDAALRTPVWPLSLGRKAFVPGAPVYLPDGLRPEGLESALRTYPWLARTRGEAAAWTRRLASNEVRLRLVMDARPKQDTAEAAEEQLELRQDVPLDFAERRFAMRSVQVSSTPLTQAMIKEESACFSPS
jgi:CRISPR system Cascade subunit CasD